MTTLTRNFPTVADYVKWLRERAAEADDQANYAPTQKVAAQLHSRASTIRDIADDLSGKKMARIAEIHG